MSDISRNLNLGFNINDEAALATLDNLRKSIDNLKKDAANIPIGTNTPAPVANDSPRRRNRRNSDNTQKEVSTLKQLNKELQLLRAESLAVARAQDRANGAFGVGSEKAQQFAERIQKSGRIQKQQTAVLKALRKAQRDTTNSSSDLALAQSRVGNAVTDANNKLKGSTFARNLQTQVAGANKQLEGLNDLISTIDPRVGSILSTIQKAGRNPLFENQSLVEADDLKGFRADLAADAGQATLGIKNLNGELSRTPGIANTATASTNNFGMSLQGITKFINPVTVGLAAVGAAAFNATKEFNKTVPAASEVETGLLKIQAIGNLTQDQFNQLQKDAQTLGLRFSEFSTAEIVQGLEQVVKAGVDAAEAPLFLEDALNASIATNEDFVSVVERNVGALKGLGLNVSDNSRLLDQLSIASQKTKSDVLSLSDSISKFGSLANTLEQDSGELIAISAALQDVSLDASEAGTVIRNTLLRINEPAGNTAKALIKEFGLGFETIEKDGVKTTRSLLDNLTSLSEQTQNLASDEQAKIFANIFGARAVAGVTALIKRIRDGESSLQDLVEQVQNSEGAIAAQVEITRQAYERQNQAIENAQGVANEAIGAIIKDQANLSDSAIKTKAVLDEAFDAGIFDRIGMGLASFIEPFTSLRPLITDLSISFRSFLADVSALLTPVAQFIGLLGAGIFPVFTGILQGIGFAFRTIANIVNPLITFLGDLVGRFTDVEENAQLLNSTLEKIGVTIGVVAGAFLLWTGIPAILTAIASGFTALGTAIAAASASTGVIGTVLTAIAGVLTGPVIAAVLATVGVLTAGFVAVNKFADSSGEAIEKYQQRANESLEKSKDGMTKFVDATGETRELTKAEWEKLEKELMAINKKVIKGQELTQEEFQTLVENGVIGAATRFKNTLNNLIPVTVIIFKKIVNSAKVELSKLGETLSTFGNTGNKSGGLVGDFLRAVLPNPKKIAEEVEKSNKELEKELNQIRFGVNLGAGKKDTVANSLLNNQNNNSDNKNNKDKNNVVTVQSNAQATQEEIAANQELARIKQEIAENQLAQKQKILEIDKEINSLEAQTRSLEAQKESIQLQEKAGKISKQAAAAKIKDLDTTINENKFKLENLNIDKQELIVDDKSLKIQELKLQEELKRAQAAKDILDQKQKEKKALEDIEKINKQLATEKDPNKRADLSNQRNVLQKQAMEARQAVESIQNTLKTAIDSLGLDIKKLTQDVTSNRNKASDNLNKRQNQINNAVNNATSSGSGDITGKLEGAAKNIAGVFVNGVNDIEGALKAFDGIFKDIAGIFQSVVGSVGGQASGLASSVGGAFGGFSGGVFGAITSIVSTGIGIATTIISGIKKRREAKIKAEVERFKSTIAFQQQRIEEADNLITDAFLTETSNQIRAREEALEAITAQFNSLSGKARARVEAQFNQEIKKLEVQIRNLLIEQANRFSDFRLQFAAVEFGDERIVEVGKSLQDAFDTAFKGIQGGFDANQVSAILNDRVQKIRDEFFDNIDSQIEENVERRQEILQEASEELANELSSLGDSLQDELTQAGFTDRQNLDESLRSQIENAQANIDNQEAERQKILDEIAQNDQELLEQKRIQSDIFNQFFQEANARFQKAVQFGSLEEALADTGRQIGDVQVNKESIMRLANTITQRIQQGITNGLDQISNIVR